MAAAGYACQTLVMAAERPRRVEVQPFPSNRRLVTAGLRAGRRMVPMYGLVDVDVTKANRLLASHHPPSSLTAFVVASVARAAAAHPQVHAYRNWRGQLVTHHHVDVVTMVEIPTPQGLLAFLMFCTTRMSVACPISLQSSTASSNSHRQAVAAAGSNGPPRLPLIFPARSRRCMR